MRAGSSRPAPGATGRFAAALDEGPGRGLDMVSADRERRCTARRDQGRGARRRGRRPGSARTCSPATAPTSCRSATPALTADEDRYLSRGKRRVEADAATLAALLAVAPTSSSTAARAPVDAVVTPSAQEIRERPPAPRRHRRHAVRPRRAARRRTGRRTSCRSPTAGSCRSPASASDRRCRPAATRP